MSVSPELEAMARAIHSCDEPGALEDASEDWRKFCFTAARAALMAIRTPSAGMKRSGLVAVETVSFRSVSSTTSQRAWQAMIDHILSNPDRGEDA